MQTLLESDNPWRCPLDSGVRLRSAFKISQLLKKMMWNSNPHLCFRKFDLFPPCQVAFGQRRVIFGRDLWYGQLVTLFS